MLDIGATIILTDINEVELRSAVTTLRKSYPNANIHMSMDVTSETIICDTAKDIVGLGLRVDILINNAAINPANSLSGNSNYSFRKFSLDHGT